MAAALPWADPQGVRYGVWRGASWYILATQDHTVHPDLQRWVSKRMGATVTEVASSHVPMLSQPDVVIDVIRKAAAAVQKADRNGHTSPDTQERSSFAERPLLFVDGVRWPLLHKADLTAASRRSLLTGKRKRVVRNATCAHDPRQTLRLTLARCALVQTIGRDRLTTPEVQLPRFRSW
jgi:dihydropteroate synthase